MVLRYSGLLFAATFAFAQDTGVEQPLGLIIDGQLTRIAAKGHWNPPLTAGTEVFAGDVVRNDSEATATVAFCPASAVFEIPPNTNVSVTAAELLSNPPLRRARDLPACSLPRVHRTPSPGTEHPLESRGAPPAPNLNADQTAKMRNIDALDADPKLHMLARATRASVLESLGQTQAAIGEMTALWKEHEEATWSLDVISRLTLAKLPQAPSGPEDLQARGRIRDPSDLPDATPDFSKGKTYALIIGLSKYPEGKRVTDLHFADRDAFTFREFLQTTRGGKVPDNQIQFLINQQVTRDAIDQALVQLVEGKGARNNTLIVFVAAHGHYICTDKDPDWSIDQKCDPDKEEPVIIVRDGETEAASVTGYPMRRFRDLVTARASDFGRVLVFIDVCHGGNVVWRAGDPALASSTAVKELEAKNGRLGIMSASSVELRGARASEYAYESEKLKHGVFTYYLLRGLNGDVKAIDSKVLFDRVFSQLSSAVQDYTGRLLQSPERYRSDPRLAVLDSDAAPELKLEANPEAPDENFERRGAPAGPVEQQFEAALGAGRLLATDPDNAAASLDRVRAQTGDQSALYQSLAARLRIALEDKGQDIIIQYLQGEQAHLEAADYARCAEYFARALEIAPDAPFDESRRLFCKGRQMVYEGDYSGATDLLLRAIQIDPARPYAYNALGIAYLEQANQSDTFFDPAIALFRESIRLAPYWAYPRHNLALALSERGRYLEASAQYIDAKTVAPMYSYLPYNLGLLYQQMNRIDDARGSYRDAEAVAAKRCGLRLGPKFTQGCPERALPRTGLGAVAAFQKKRTAAERLFKEAQNDDPSDLLAKHNLAALYADWRGHEPDAEAIWKGILQKDPNHVPSLMGYGSLLKKLNREDDALIIDRRLMIQACDYVAAQVDVATILVHKGELDAAAAMLQRLLRERPSSADVWAAQAELLEKTGGPDAANAWQAALRLSAGTADGKKIRERRKQLARIK
ncbi:MAG: caspase family protein [Bryobacterales bacterium]|nr:caspase family protein [Bryobacterales bacterium]MBV9398495.1 caspase family protein [Bryobacterales bacterium]